jgi:hypothetical protein
VERQRLKTGTFGLGTMIHSVHMTGAPYFFTTTTFAGDPFA